MTGPTMNRAVFAWRVALSHTIAYSVAGMFAVFVMDYGRTFAEPPLVHFMRPVEDPLVALSPALQVFRGLIVAFVFWFFRAVLFESPRGYLRIALLILGLSYASTIGPAPGSFEGYLFTTLSVKQHLLGVPELLLYTASFSLILYYWQKTGHKVFNILSVIYFVLMTVMGGLGYLDARGLLTG